MQCQLQTLVLFATLIISVPVRAAIDAADPEQPDLYAVIALLRDWAQFLYNPVADAVGILCVLIAAGAWTVFPKGFAAVVQKFIYVFMIGTAPVIVPILVAIASK